MRNCNLCASRSCRVVDTFRKTHVGDMSASCPNVVKPKPYTRKLIYTAMLSNPQGVHDVLARAKMELQEIDRWPGFRLVVREVING